MKITFQNFQIDLKLKSKTKIKLWIRGVVESHKKSIGEINYVFTNDEELLNYNQKFLNHNTLTDILTFDSSEGKKISGDIIISLERVGENAKKFNVHFENELSRVMIHGVFHLLGFKDKTEKQKLEMRKLEDKAIKQIPN